MVKNMDFIALKQFIYDFADHNSLARKVLVHCRATKLARRLGSRRESSNRSPVLVNIELTNNCPMKCVMCVRTNNMTRELGFVDFITFKSLIDQYVSLSPEDARSQDTWLHHFGESLMHPEFGQLISYAVAKGVRACMSINPIMLTPSIADDLLGSGISKLIISLDGHDNDSFQKIRGVKNLYEKSKANLLEFLRKKVELGVQTHIVLSMINFGLNTNSIEQQRAYWESLPGIDEFMAKPISLWSGDAADVNELLDERVDNQALRLRYSTPACNVPWESMCMTWEGDIVPCCFDYDKKYSLGNIKEKTLAEIWNGERMRALRREFITNNVSNALCRNCPILYPPKG